MAGSDPLDPATKDADANKKDYVAGLSTEALKGKRLGGSILVFPGSMGSAGAWRFIYQLFKHGTHPLALIAQTLPDPSVVQGAILAGIPTICEPDENVLKTIENGDWLSVDGEKGTVTVLG